MFCTLNYVRCIFLVLILRMYRMFKRWFCKGE